jgi:hypothetical protein
MDIKEQDWQSFNWVTNGNGDGGQSFGVGFCIAWQRGALADNGRNGAFLTEVLEACLTELIHKNSIMASAENDYAIQSLRGCLRFLYARRDRRKAAASYGKNIPDA